MRNITYISGANIYQAWSTRDNDFVSAEDRSFIGIFFSRMILEGGASSYLQSSAMNSSHLRGSSSVRYASNREAYPTPTRLRQFSSCAISMQGIPLREIVNGFKQNQCP